MSRARSARAIAAIAIAMTVLTLVTAAPASAGTLTAASFSPGTTAAGASGVNYDYAFTTATSATLSQVRATVPAGTSATGSRYLALAGGVNHNEATTPDSTGNSITGDIDIRVQVAMTAWVPAARQTLVAKESPSSLSYNLQVDTAGKLRLDTTADGTTSVSAKSSVTTGFAAGSTDWVRATRQMNDSAGHNLTNFYASSDGGVTWSNIGSSNISNSGVTSIVDNASVLEIGSTQGGTSQNLAGTFITLRCATELPAPLGQILTRTQLLRPHLVLGPQQLRAKRGP